MGAFKDLGYTREMAKDIAKDLYGGDESKSIEFIEKQVDSNTPASKLYEITGMDTPLKKTLTKHFSNQPVIQDIENKQSNQIQDVEIPLNSIATKESSFVDDLNSGFNNVGKFIEKGVNKVSNSLRNEFEKELIK